MITDDDGWVTMTSVLALAADKSGCGWYRIVTPAWAMKQIGKNAIVGDDVRVDAGILPDGSVFVDQVLEPVDRIVIQRPVTQKMHAMAERAGEQGMKITVELDDDFERIHANHVTKTMASETGFGGKWENAGWLRRTIGLADRLVVSSAALARSYGRPGQVVTVMENAASTIMLGVADERLWQINDTRDYAIGWTGTLGTHVADLEEARGAPGAASVLLGWKIHCLGDEGAIRALAGSSASMPQFRASHGEWTDSIVSYYREMSKISVGVVPLVDSEFNRAKSDVKGLEMSLLTGFGRAVTSRIGEYSRLYHESLEGPDTGIITVRNRYRDWQKAIIAAAEAGPRDVDLRLSTARVIDPVAWWHAWTGD